MDFKGLIILALATVCTLAQDVDDITVGGVTGKSVRLTCDLPTARPPRVRWVDYVYNTDANPSVIFNSENNEALVVDPRHENAANFYVNSDFSLTISKLKVDPDPGNYICESRVGGDLHRRSYYLTVGAKPECSGEVDLKEGSSTTLECQSEYSGSQPTLEWLRGSEEIESDENFEIRLAKRSLDLTATYRDDKQTYTCRMTIGDVVEECHVTLSVKHLTRDLKLTPEEHILQVGEELNCSASGNPSPMMSLHPLSSKGQAGPGWRSIVMEPEWQGQDIDVKCIASNNIDGKTEIIAKNITIKVIEPKKVEEPLAASAFSFSSAVVIGVIVAVFIMACLVVIIVIIVVKKRNHRRPKGSKPLPSKEEISQSQYGQPV